jgi:cold shock CspA family protein
MKWVVSEFLPDKHFGFCESTQAPEVKVFFHVRDFIRTHPGQVGPVPGEQVLVPETSTGFRGLFAPQVLRVSSPIRSGGFVVSYNPDKGWGFIQDPGNSQQVFFHRRDMITIGLPLPGAAVEFTYGKVKDKSRACWVCVGRGNG